MKAKYKRGRKIESVGDFEKSEARFYRVLFGKDERTKHRGFLESWQYHTLWIFIHKGCVHEADAIETDK